MRGAFLAVVALAALVLAGCGGSDTTETAAAGGDVVELTSVDELRTAFEADRGKPRLVLLLSPT